VSREDAETLYEVVLADRSDICGEREEGSKTLTLVFNHALDVEYVLSGWTRPKPCAAAEGAVRLRSNVKLRRFSAFTSWLGTRSPLYTGLLLCLWAHP
jgi:hypothetical protein